MKPGSLVIPKSKNPNVASSVFLTPQCIESAEDIEKWTEWRCNQFGIILEEMNDKSGMLVIVPEGIGMCFSDELIEVK